MTVTSRTQRSRPQPFAFAPWLGRGAATLGLAVMLVACGQPVATQPGGELAEPTATATVTPCRPPR